MVPSMADEAGDYTTQREDLGLALEELLEAGFRVVCGPVGQEVFTSPDPAPPDYHVRILAGGERYEGTGGTADEAFEEALREYGRG